MKTAVRDWLIFCVLCAVCVWLVGCKTAPTTARRVLEAQSPGLATGAGATLTGPANSAAPTTQIAERSFTFSVPLPAPSVPIIAIPRAEPPQVSIPAAPQPIMVTERVSTTIGQHQDAAGIIAQAAKMADGLGKVQWLGVAMLVLGVAGLLWSAGHDQGYPLVFWKCVGAGLLLVMFGDNPWWLAAAAVPLLLYAAQKFGILRPFP